MTGFQLRQLRVTGAGKFDAEISFEAGLNVVSGPSDTGKSYLVEAIDFMLGGQTPPRQIPESVGYDQAHLTIEASDGRTYKLTRALQGGDFLLSDPANPGAAVTLGARHSASDADNISTFLLRLAGFDQKRLRKNANNELQNLSFRNLAPLLVVDEESIIKKGSPIFTGDSTQKTVQTSLFKLLLTGVDDRALVATKKRAIAKAEIEGQIELLDQLIEDYEVDLRELTEDFDGLAEQEERLQAAIAASEQALSSERAAFEAQEQARREAWAKRERIEVRQSEIDALEERFVLLDQNYASDLQRLEAIAEAGQYFVALTMGPCPLCGAAGGDHQHESVPHDGDIERLRAACASEIAKIQQLRFELSETMMDLEAEGDSLFIDAKRANTSFDDADALVRETLVPALSAARHEHNLLLEARSKVRQARALVDRIAALQVRRAEAEAALKTAGRVTDERPGLPAASVQALSIAVETLLDAWHFPHEKPVYFEERQQDLVLGSRRRGEQGKGLRALTHASFTIGLQLALKALGRDPIGFVVLDSPLVTFREPDDVEELPRGQKVAVKQAFYSDLASRAASSQVIIFENEDPDLRLQDKITTHFFSKQTGQGRYGFFPVSLASAPS